VKLYFQSLEYFFRVKITLVLTQLITFSSFHGNKTSKESERELHFTNNKVLFFFFVIAPLISHFSPSLSFIERRKKSFHFRLAAKEIFLYDSRRTLCVCWFFTFFECVSHSRYLPQIIFQIKRNHRPLVSDSFFSVVCVALRFFLLHTQVCVNYYFFTRTTTY
jgi:hypothetical protein